MLLPQLDAAAVQAAPALRRAVAAEIALIALVLAVTAGLAHTPPRRAHAASATGTLVQLVAADPQRAACSASLSVTPAHPGRNAISVHLRDRMGQPFDPAELTLAISNPAAGVEPMIRVLLRQGPGEYRYEGNELAFPGHWQLSVRARIDDFERVELGALVEIR